MNQTNPNRWFRVVWFKAVQFTSSEPNHANTRIWVLTNFVKLAIHILTIMANSAGQHTECFFCLCYNQLPWIYEMSLRSPDLAQLLGQALSHQCLAQMKKTCTGVLKMRF